MDLDSVDLGDDASFMSAFAKNSGVKDGKTLRTSGSDNSDNGIAMTSYTVADILQGAHAYKPVGLSANAFNQVLTSQLKRTASLNEDGGLDGDIVARLGSRKRFLPDDLMNGSFLDAANNAGSSYNDPNSAQPSSNDVQSDGGNAVTAKYSDTTGVSGQTTAAMANGKSIIVGTYKGTTVNYTVIAAWKALVDAAEKDGIQINGGGYREAKQQIDLRRSHCGSSHFAIYEMSPSSCHPPTAKPGTSMHEKGLAVDVKGIPISPGSNNAKFNWLKKNAGKYGFYNLPSEGWHWSTSGG